MNVLPVAVLIGALAAPAWATEPADPFWASAALVHRTLEERAPNGNSLLTETGPMLRLSVGARRALPGGGAVSAELTTLGGELDYEGQTQAGVPLTTNSRHRDARIDFGWRPVAPMPWGEPWLVVGWGRNQRTIMGTAAASGLRETSSASLAGVRWRSPVFQPSAQWQMRVEAEALISLQHRLQVDFGGLFDGLSFDAGRQRRAALRLVATPAQSPWDWTVEWSRLNQSASAPASLFRGGAAAGTVRQPRLTQTDLSLRLTRRF